MREAEHAVHCRDACIVAARAEGNSVAATSACAITAMPANSAYALMGISGDAANAKSAAEVATLAAMTACGVLPLSCLHAVQYVEPEFCVMLR